MICTRLDEKNNVLLQIARDDVQLSEIIAAIDRRIYHPKYDPHRPVLWDFSRAGWDSAHQEYNFVTEEIGAWVKQRRPLGPVAIVFNSATEQALFHTFYGSLEWVNLQTFTEYDAALGWLTAQPAPNP